MTDISTDLSNPTLSSLTFRDNSRLSEFKLCPRKFFFHYVCDVVPGWIRPPLDFGSAWHKAMDYVWIKIFEDETHKQLLEGSFNAFLEEWQERGHPKFIDLGDEAKYKGRTPSTAIEMLDSYIKLRSTWIKTLELIAVELPFAVPLDPDNPRRFYVGRLDKVYKENGFYWVGEHKTNSLYSIEHGMQYGFTSMFDPNSQVDGYSFALKMLYGAKTKGVNVDAALVHKTHHDIFKFIPVNKAVSHSNEWLEDCNYWWDRVDEANLKEQYPRNAPGACRTIYGQCEYKDVCMSTVRTREFEDGVKGDSKECPSGYKIDKWEPFSFEELEEAVKKVA